jgi:hypothetical protein
MTETCLPERWASQITMARTARMTPRVSYTTDIRSTSEPRSRRPAAERPRGRRSARSTGEGLENCVALSSTFRPDYLGYLDPGSY